MNNKQVREVSGSINSSDPVVALIYRLIRDHLPAGQLEQIVMDLEEAPGITEYQFTNGWLAQYAQNIVSRLQVLSGGHTSPLTGHVKLLLDLHNHPELDSKGADLITKKMFDLWVDMTDEEQLLASRLSSALLDDDRRKFPRHKEG